MTNYLDLARAVPASPRVAPLDEWASEAAQALIAACLRRVSAAWGATRTDQRDPALQAHLGRAAVCDGAARQKGTDMNGLHCAATGRVTCDPEPRFTSQGKALATFNIVV